MCCQNMRTKDMTERKSENLGMIEQAVLNRISQGEIKGRIHQLALPYKELMAYYRCAMMQVETKFNVLNEELSLQYDHNPIETIKTRLKTPESIANKLIKKQVPLTAESIEESICDVAGVRVICSFQSDIYMLADALLKQDDITLLKRKDYIANPKENGYRSLHLIVQIPIYLHDQKKLMKDGYHLHILYKPNFLIMRNYRVLYQILALLNLPI